VFFFTKKPEFIIIIDSTNTAVAISVDVEGC